MGKAEARMTREEARTCIDTVHSHLRNARNHILDLHEREGWKALGYESWRACVVAEFPQNQRYLYYQLKAAKVETNICTMVQNPRPAKIGNIPERQLRPLADFSPEEQKVIWEEAVKTAPNGKVTTKHVIEVVKKRKALADPAVEARAVHADAMAHALVAINHLQGIRRNDPKRREALERVVSWIARNIHGRWRPRVPLFDAKADAVTPEFQAAYESAVSAIKGEISLKWANMSRSAAAKRLAVLLDGILT